MACRDDVVEAQAARALYHEGLLRDYQASLVSVCLKRAAVVSAAAARAATVSERISREWARWVSQEGLESSGDEST